MNHCFCESALCDHERACGEEADLRFHVDYVGQMCTQCVANLGATGGAEYLHLKEDLMATQDERQDAIDQYHDQIEALGVGEEDFFGPSQTHVLRTELKDNDDWVYEVVDGDGWSHMGAWDAAAIVRDRDEELAYWRRQYEAEKAVEVPVCEHPEYEDGRCLECGEWHPVYTDAADWE